MVETKASRNAQRLKIKTLKLNTLLEITKAINHNLPEKDIFKLFEEILQNSLNIGRAILYSFDGENWSKNLVFGVDDHFQNLDVERDLYHVKEITVIEAGPKDFFKAFDVVVPIFHKNLPLAYLMVGDIDEDELRISPIITHLPFIQTLASIIMVAIENKRLARESIQQERTKRELELAREMQSMLFPEKLPDNEFVQVESYYLPHQQVGGDYYDYILLNNEEVIFCMADVSGKGVSAALLMSNFQANLRALCRIHSTLTGLITELNEKVNSNAKGEKFITLFLAKYNKKSRKLSYINAAHNPPILIQKKNGTDKVELLRKGCTGIGMFEEIPKIIEGEIILDKEALLVCYTDGITELENSQGEAFELDRLVKLVSDNGTKDMSQLNHNIIDALERFKENLNYLDDVALLSCRFH